MVEHVGKDGLEFCAEALVDVDILLDLEVDVPERHTAKYASPASASVQAQNRVADTGKHGCRVCEYVDVSGGADAVGSSNIVVPRAAEVVGAGKNAVFVGEEVVTIAFTEGLTVTVSGVEFEGQSAARCEDRSERPAAQETTHHAVLTLEERRLVNREKVVDEFAVKRLEAVAGADVVRIDGGELAGRLHDGHGS